MHATKQKIRIERQEALKVRRAERDNLLKQFKNMKEEERQKILAERREDCLKRRSYRNK